ncbi:MAG: hypothetical protein IT460_01820 [Planctomycetes bacterium]|nr:hypothetical protein [Planctomycetota bacterium]
MKTLSRLLLSCTALALVGALSGCCSDCEKPPPCCPKAKAPDAAPAPAPTPAPAK